MRYSYRLRLSAAMICLGLVWSAGTIAPLQAQADSSTQSSVVKSKRKRDARRRSRRRATVSQSTAVKRDTGGEVVPPAPPAQTLPLPSRVNVDPSLFPSQKGSGIGNGSGTGEGVGGGVGPGQGSSAGGGGRGGVVDYNRPFSPRDVDRKVRILARPEPLMTEAAKKNKTFGTVVLRAVMTAAGTVTSIRVVKELPDGLSESAVEAARHIKFQPAMKDGRAVSQYIQIEYNFNDY